MNKRMIAYVIGILLLCEAGLMLLPTIVAAIYGEAVIKSFIFSIIILLVGGIILVSFKPKNKTVYPRDGLVIVSLSWIFVSLFGALPFYISGEIPNFINALFETVSGFTTTGASILSDVEALSKSIIFWRSFTHWIGGMGVLIFIMAVLPLAGGGTNLNIMKAESAGPSVGKLVPSSKKTARILYGMYLFFTVVEIVLLLLGGMPLFDSVTLSFGTAGTGGFGIVNSSIAGYSMYTQSVIAIFMALFGVSFNIYFLLICRNFKDALKNQELHTYLGIIIAAVFVITINIKGQFDTIGEAIHHAFFQVSSIITTTGYATADFNLWPELSKMVILMLMFIGGCAGSTAGGFKISRVILLIKSIGKEIRSVSHPRGVRVITYEGKRVNDDIISGTTAYLAIYVLIFVISLLIISLDKMDMLTNISATAATLNNIGPGFGAVGPTGNFDCYNGFSKVIFIINMLLGRLEIFPLLCILFPSKSRKLFSKKKI